LRLLPRSVDRVPPKVVSCMPTYNMVSIYAWKRPVSHTSSKGTRRGDHERARSTLVLPGLQSASTQRGEHVRAGPISIRAARTSICKREHDKERVGTSVGTDYRTPWPPVQPSPSMTSKVGSNRVLLPSAYSRMNKEGRISSHGSFPGLGRKPSRPI
jgi:hypothetical protein